MVILSTVMGRGDLVVLTVFNSLSARDRQGVNRVRWIFILAKVCVRRIRLLAFFSLLLKDAWRVSRPVWEEALITGGFCLELIPSSLKACVRLGKVLLQIYQA